MFEIATKYNDGSFCYLIQIATSRKNSMTIGDLDDL